jgi:hypothetical protein
VCVRGSSYARWGSARRRRQEGAREAVVTVAAGGVGGGVEDISAFAARGTARAADEDRPGPDHEAGVVELFDQGTDYSYNHSSSGGVDSTLSLQ